MFSERVIDPEIHQSISFLLPLHLLLHLLVLLLRISMWETSLRPSLLPETGRLDFTTIIDAIKFSRILLSFWFFFSYEIMFRFYRNNLVIEN